MLQYLVTKGVLFLIIFNLTSCKIQNLEKSNLIYEIVNTEIDFLKSKTGVTYLEKSTNCNLILSQYDNLLFDEKYYEFHLFTILYSLPKKEFEYFFNKTQLDNYVAQCKNNEFIDFSKIKNVQPLDLNDKKSEIREKYSKLAETKNVIMLSKPIFTKDKKYAIIGWSTNIGYNSIGSSISIYKKDDNEWIVYKRFLLGVG